MDKKTQLRDDPAYQAAWTELLEQVRAANASDAAFWEALGDDVAVSARAGEALAEAWTQAQGDWPTALQGYRWWMQDHPELFPTVNAIAVEMAVAKVEEKMARMAEAEAAKRPKPELH